MASNLKVTNESLGIHFDCKYRKLDVAEKPVIVKKVGEVVVEERTFFQYDGVDIPIPPGSTHKKIVDSDYNEYDKKDVKYYYNGEEVSEKSETKIFEITSFEPVKKYTDNFIISKYYEVAPSNNGMIKDLDREIAISKNLNGMWKLWEYLTTNNVVARGEFNTSSRGFISSDGYIRAVSIDNKWGLEIGVFSEEKVFHHLNEGAPKETRQEEKKKVLKRIG